MSTSHSNSVGLTIVLALATAVGAMFFGVYRSWHPGHAYDAADLARDTQICKNLGFGIAPRMNHTRSGERWIQGADCMGPDGATIPLPRLLRTTGVPEHGK